MTRQTYRLRGPEDLLAVVPCVLGFHPEESLVMLTFPRHGSGFHARIDLPTDPESRAAVEESLLEALHRNDVDRVVLVAYGDSDVVARLALESAEAAFTAEGIDVLDLLWAHDGRWRSLSGSGSGAYDARSHPFAARSVVEGRVTLGSRAELQATLAADPEGVAACRTALERVGGEEVPGVDWAVRTVGAHVRERRRIGDDDLARLLAALAERRTREAVWALPGREVAREHVELWRDVVRRSPDEFLPAPAALLALCAWLSGDGALAWCAVDRCQAVDPEHRLAARVADLLLQAVPPSRWDRGDPALAGSA